MNQGSQYNYKCIHNRYKYRCRDCDGSSLCSHYRYKYQCRDCDGANICSHDRFKYQCIDCGGASICSHGKQRASCKNCGNEVKKTIDIIIRNSRYSDKLYNRYDANNFIDKCFIEGLIEEYSHCYWPDCRVKLQYVKYQEDLCSIERLDNRIGHIKSNVVLACLKCNHRKKSNRNN